MSDNGNGQAETIRALMEEAKRLASESKDQAERAQLLLLSAIVSRQQEIREDLVRIKTSPFVALGMFMSEHPRVFFGAMFGGVLLVLILASLSESSLFQGLRLIP